MAGVYIHIPFCVVKCPYCDFYSLPARPDEMDRYLSALLSEIGAAPTGTTAETVYFGGGTPILFGPKRLSSVMDALKKRFLFQSGAEITLEANPFPRPKKNMKNSLNWGLIEFLSACSRPFPQS